LLQKKESTKYARSNLLFINDYSSREHCIAANSFAEVRKK
jgi:hypothetical protein